MRNYVVRRGFSRFACTHRDLHYRMACVGGLCGTVQDGRPFISNAAGARTDDGSSPRHPKGQLYAKATGVNGKPVMRVTDPAYGGTTRLMCHTGLKEERDVAGMSKEGWKAGERADAICRTIPLR